MDSGKQSSILGLNQKVFLGLLMVLIISSLFLFKNFLLKPTFLIKSFGELSVEPEIAFKTNKPIFLEFYAEWCEVCKEMAPKVSSLKDEYEKDINFVFLNVDNKKWENYIRKFNVNGIPQVNLLDGQANLKATFIGRQDEKNIKQSLENLIENAPISPENFSQDLSEIKNNKNYLKSPRSHG